MIKLSRLRDLAGMNALPGYMMRVADVKEIRDALPALLKAVDILGQYEGTRHIRRSLMERAGIEVDE